MSVCREERSLVYPSFPFLDLRVLKLIQHLNTAVSYLEYSSVIVFRTVYCYRTYKELVLYLAAKL